MDERIISYVQINTFLNQPIYITAELGVMKCPKLSDLNGDLILYSSQVSTYITLYDENNNDFFDKLISENKIQDFALFAKSFFDYDQVKIINNEIFYFKHIVKDNEELDVMIGCLNNNTISIFMDVIKIMHHKSNEFDEDDSEDSQIVKEMKKRIRQEKKRIQELNSQKNGIGILDILSSVCARHPSLNPLNIKDLNYYQLLDQFIRLGKIDAWEVNMDVLASGNMPSESQKEIKHYTDNAD